MAHNHRPTTMTYNNFSDNTPSATNHSTDYYFKRARETVRSASPSSPSSNGYIDFDKIPFNPFDTPPAASLSYECATCERLFPLEAPRDQHCDDTGHARYHECDRCDQSFHTFDAAFDHMESENHFQHQCRRCHKTYLDQKQLHEHEGRRHYMCAECGQSFNNHEGIQQHLRSRLHYKTNKMSCPLCDKPYSTADDVSRSRSRMARCEPASGVAEAKHCTIVPTRNSAKDFKILGCLINRLDSETCGAMRFNKVQAGVEKLIRGGRLLEETFFRFRRTQFISVHYAAVRSEGTGGSLL